MNKYDNHSLYIQRSFVTKRSEKINRGWFASQDLPGNLPLKIKNIKQLLDNIRIQISWSIVKESKLELELDCLLFLEEDY